MSVNLSGFTNLPTPLKAGILIASGGGIAAGLMVLMSGLPVGVLVFIIGGIIAIGLILVLYTALVKWLRKRRAKPMEQGVVGSAAGGQAIGDPERLARVDDLRRKFEEGIQTFQSAGKSLYSLPWYVILGEPGSGKTEAVRHCGVGFPSGLQDQYQGVGGTMNMNWWFTDHGVILDTAGRLIFEEVETGRTSEWKEFLNLLRKYRPNCPVNGAMLVIPADSLIKDNMEEIERKASFIAQQFDVIQRTLDVRFPVYVMVTKCDLINGFREFFDSIDDPQLQQQIVGWSNPTDLNEPYRPSFVDDHLREIKDRLYRRRLTRLQELLMDDRSQELPAAETLYAYPQAMEQLLPRLRRYLDQVFQVGSQWACKPLFFRGIYFTSSMQEGAVLDNDLAQTLGISVESLPEGPVWQKDRAYFLRDLFMRKTFMEKGLVTRATDANKLYRRRRTLVLGSALVGVILLLFITVFGAWRFKRNVGGVHKYLSPAADNERKRDLVIVQKPPGGIYLYRGEESLDGLPGRVYKYYGDLTEQVLEWLDKRGGLGSDIETDVFGALNRAYWDGILQPLIEGLHWRFSQSDSGRESWDHRAPPTQVLAQLIALRAGQPLGDLSKDPGLDAMIQLVCPNDVKTYQAHRDELHDPLLRLHDSETGGPEFMKKMVLDRVDKTTLHEVIASSVTHFNAYWQDRVIRGTPSETTPYTVEMLVADLNDFHQKEIEIQQKYQACRYDSAVLGEWAADFNDLEQIYERLSEGEKRGPIQGSLTQAWEQAVKRNISDLETGSERLLKAFHTEDVNALDPSLMPHYENLRSQREVLLSQLRDPSLQQRVEDLDRNQWTYILGLGEHLYQRRFELYRNVTQCQPSRLPPSLAFAQLYELWQQVDRDVKKADDDLQDVANSPQKSDYFPESSKTLKTVIACFKHQLCYQIADQGLDSASRVIKDLVASEQADPNQMRNGLAGLFAIREAIAGVSDPKQKDPLELRYRELLRYAPDLAHDYRAYWFGSYFQEVCAKVGKAEGIWEQTWDRQCSALGQLRVDRIMRPLEEEIRIIKQEAHLLVSFPDGNEALAAIDQNLRDVDRHYHSACKSLCDRWYDLKIDPLVARETLLGLKPREFENNFFIADLPGKDGDLDPRLVDKFWYRLSHWTLGRLVDGVSRQIHKDLADARKDYQGRFPLAQRTREEVTLEQYRRLRRVVDQIALCETSSTLFAADTIGGGQVTNSPEIDKLLDELRFPGISETWLRDAIPIVKCMPPLMPDQYWCRVQVEESPAKIARRIEFRWGKQTIIWRDLGFQKRFDKDDDGQEQRVLPYDSSDDRLEIVFYANPTPESENEKPVFRFPDPNNPTDATAWPWHRLLTNKPGKEPGEIVFLIPEISTNPVILSVEFFEDRACTESKRFELFPKTN